MQLSVAGVGAVQGQPGLRPSADVVLLVAGGNHEERVPEMELLLTGGRRRMIRQYYTSPQLSCFLTAGTTSRPLR